MNRHGILFVFAFVSAFLATPAIAAEPSTDLRRLFPKQALVTLGPPPPAPAASAPAPAPAFAELALTPEVLAACLPDLSDVRLIDATGQQIPFAIRRSSDTRGLSLAKAVDGRIVRAERRTTRGPYDSPVSTETYDISAPAENAHGSSWALVVDSSRTQFARKIDVSGLADGRTTPLTQETLFSLPQMGARKLTVLLPATLPRVLRIVISGEGDFYVEPRFHFASSASLGGSPDLVIPLGVLSQERVDTKTRFLLARRGAIIPTALRISTSTPAFDRTVSVDSIGPGVKPVEVGRTRLFRSAPGAQNEQLDVPIRNASGDELRVDVDDGDSPELADLHFQAVVERPTLVFAAPEGQLSLFFGGGRVHPPRYDLDGLVAHPGAELSEARALAVSSLYERGALREASLGGSTQNPLFESSPALSAIMRAAADVDTRLYSHQRLLDAVPSPDGLVRFTLAPEDLAVARDDLADVRVVDGAGKQWPYLVDRDAQTALVALRIALPVRQDHHSEYRLELPVGPLSLEQIELTTAQPFFDRGYTLTGVGPGGEAMDLGTGRLTHLPRTAQSEALTLQFPRHRLRSLRLVVDDGDDAPLELRGHAPIPLPVFYLVAPKGRYRLLLGNPGDTAPTYDIERVRDLVLAVEGQSGTPGALGNNPSFHAPSRLTTTEGSRTALLWAALVVAVATLGALTFRLSRREDAPRS